MGITKLNKESEAIIFSAFFPLPGTIHTVARAEAYAFLTVCNQVSKGAEVEFITDNELLYKTFNQGREYAIQSVSEEVYADAFLTTSMKRT